MKHGSYPLDMTDIEDGSGSITIENGGNVEIDDGSGSITVRNLRGNLNIEDGYLIPKDL